MDGRLGVGDLYSKAGTPLVSRSRSELIHMVEGLGPGGARRGSHLAMAATAQRLRIRRRRPVYPRAHCSQTMTATDGAGRHGGLLSAGDPPPQAGSGAWSGNGGVRSRVAAGGSDAEPVEVVVPAVAVQVDGR
jgi:hypothetical protein